VRIGTVVELANEFDRPFQRVEVAISMIADMHHAPADGAVSIQDVQFPASEVGIRGPAMRHGVDLLVAGAASWSYSKPAKKIREKRPGA
jgi:hypothetical protein